MESRPAQGDMSMRLFPGLSITSLLILLVMPQPSHASEPSPALTREQASAFARLALKGLEQGISEQARARPRRAGRREGPEGPPSGVLRILRLALVGARPLDAGAAAPPVPRPAGGEPRSGPCCGAHLTAENLKAEADYFARKESKPFERPYGWAWLLKLAEELNGWDDPDAKVWAKNLRPLADVVVARYLEFFPKQTYPIRTGVHPNTAFGLSFAHDYARAVGDTRLIGLVEERARAYFGADADVPAGWEPGGADFFSPSLTEADLMRRVLAPAEFRAWFARFLPGAARGEPKALFQPATVTDRTDPQLVHLDGLNLSRAWCMRSIAAALPADDPARAALEASAARHAESALEHVASGDYAGEHWLASFAVYLLTP